MKFNLKELFFLVSVAFVLLSFNFTFQKANQIEGLWYSKEVANSVIKVTKEDSKEIWSAKIVKSDEKDYVGKTLFRNCVFNLTEGRYTTIVTSPSMNADINATVTINGATIKIVGKKLFFTKTFVWKRKE